MQNIPLIQIGLICVAGLMPFRQVQAQGRDWKSEYWVQQGKSALQKLKQLHPRTQERARNVILFIGDGMGSSTVTSARILEGQHKGLQGEDNLLSFESFPHTAFSKTYNVDAQVPDSAGTMTAMITGVKTRIGVLSIGPEAVRGDCEASQFHRLPTLLEQAENEGLMTGIVTSTRITHATPAALFAHAPERDWEADADIPPAAASQGCRDIASQLVHFSAGDGIDVVLAGGRQQFMPNTASDPEYPSVKGKRADGQNLIEQWLQKYGPSAQYVWNKAQFESVIQKKGKLLGLFEPSHMQYEAERVRDQEPSLSELTEAAIQRLKGSSKGFFLMVEAGRIDHAHHEGLAGKALLDTVELSRAVARARSLTSESDTLIIVTADHSHTLTMSGYPVRGNPILGKVFDVEAGGLALDQLGKPYTTLAYANGPGSWQSKDEPNSARPDLSDINTKALDFKQHAAVPLDSETHSGEDVGIYAQGPMSHLVRGVMEQNVLYYIMREALKPDPVLNQASSK